MLAEENLVSDWVPASHDSGVSSSSSAGPSVGPSVGGASVRSAVAAVELRCLCASLINY